MKNCVLCNKIIKGELNKVGQYFMCTPCYEEAHDPLRSAVEDIGRERRLKETERVEIEKEALGSKLDVRITVRMTTAERQALEERAKDKTEKYNKDVTASDVVRFAIQEYLRIPNKYQKKRR